MQTKKKLFLGCGNLANYITYTGLLFSIAGCFFALYGNMALGVSCLVVSGMCDLFDGLVARRLKRTDWEKQFGIALDTVVDVVSFGVTPVIIAFSAAGSSWYMLAACAVYILCAVTRLAYFNTTVDVKSGMKFYRGLPVTYISLILPAVMLFGSATANVVTLFVVAILFILNIKIPKPRGIWYGIFPLLAAALIVLWWVL